MKRILLVMTAVGSVACGNSQPSATNTAVPPASAPAANRQYLLEQIDEAAVVQLYADGFAGLPIKLLVFVMIDGWHLIVESLLRGAMA